MTYLSTAARAAPSHLLLSPRFWYANRSIVAAGALGLGLIFALWGLTYPGTARGLLSILIQGLALWGIAVALRMTAVLEVDDALARLVELKSVRILSKVKGRVVESVEIEQLEGLIPDNPRWDQGVIRLCQAILEAASERRYPPVESVTQPIRERSVGYLFHLRSLQQIALQLGILGTFIGLVLAILEVQKTLLDGLDPTVLDRLVGSLHLAFGTSIAGLQVSVVLGLVLMSLRRRQERFFHNVDSAATALIQLARRMEVGDEYLVEFEQIRNALQALKVRVREQSVVAENQTSEIASGLERLAQVKERFDGFLEGVHEEQNRLLAEMKNVYEIISPQQTAQALEASLQRSIERVAKKFRAGLQEGSSELERYSETLTELRAVMVEVREQGLEHVELLDRGRETVQEATERLDSMTDRTTRLHGEMLERFEKASKIDAESLLQELEGILKRAEDAMKERWEGGLESVERHLKEQRSAVQRSNRLLGDLLTRPSFFDRVFVRPVQAVRNYLVGARA